ncbi:hypothetical protein WICMUC_005204 [Wickerhamomyces mucosus]|uniref:Mitochondrial 15S rRNA processing factor CCM1 n=1 Tax=Wickerhamomyces mucosus TaxID=1378264 RepID=A0A9P8T6U9_9ASCO|nr:hypothetical protein WICMUC_005204 [Wickerhamomyces mucosus]
MNSRRPQSTIPSGSSMELTESTSNEIHNFEPPKERLLQILNKPKKVPQDIQDLIVITKIFIVLPDYDELMKDYMTEIYDTLLKYKKFSEVKELISSKIYCDVQDKIILVKSHLYLKEFEPLKDLINTLNSEEMKIVLKELSSYFIDIVKKPIKAYQLWILICSKEYPDMRVSNHVNSKFYMQILFKILRKVTVVNDALTVTDKLLKTDKLRSNISYTLSFAYRRLGFFQSVIKLYQLTPHELRSSSQLANTTLAHILLNQHQKAFELWNENFNTKNKVINDMISNSLNTISDFNNVSSDLLMNILRSGIVHEKDFISILKRALANSVVLDSISLFEAYKSSGSQISTEMINAFLACSKNSYEWKYFSQQFNALDLQPSQKSFLEILKQFSAKGDYQASINLIDALIQKGEVINTNFFIEIINGCIVSGTKEPLPRVFKLMKQAKVEFSSRLVDRLISLNYSLNQFKEVVRLIEHKAIKTPSLGMLSLAMSSYFNLNDKKSAGKVYQRIVSSNFTSDARFYLTQIQYYTFHKNFDDASNIINVMKQQGTPPTQSHYHALMSAYNKNHKYHEVIQIFGQLTAEGNVLTARLYRELLISLVKLGIANEKNFEQPSLVADELLKADASNNPKFIPFKTLKPLINSLIKFYKADDALRLIHKYSEQAAVENFSRNINAIKQQLLLYSSKNQHRDYKLLFFEFQGLIRDALPEDSKAPPRLKKIYNSLMKTIVKFYELERNISGLSTLFSDLLFIHKFTFDSHTINHVVRHMMRNPATFHKAMEIIESKLIGGYISNSTFRKKNVRRLSKGLTAFSSDKRRSKPALAWGVISRNENIQIIYSYVLKSVRDRKQELYIVLNELEMQYPRVMNNIKRKLIKKLEAREKALEENPELGKKYKKVFQGSEIA